MRFTPGLSASALFLVGLWTPLDARAIITRDDVPDAEYVLPDADYPELVDLFGAGDCIGTVIAPPSLLTVAHCAKDMDPGATLVVEGLASTTPWRRSSCTRTSAAGPTMSR